MRPTTKAQLTAGWHCCPSFLLRPPFSVAGATFTQRVQCKGAWCVVPGNMMVSGTERGTRDYTPRVFKLGRTPRLSMTARGARTFACCDSRLPPVSRRGLFSSFLAFAPCISARTDLVALPPLNNKMGREVPSRCLSRKEKEWPLGARFLTSDWRRSVETCVCVPEKPGLWAHNWRACVRRPLVGASLRLAYVHVRTRSRCYFHNCVEHSRIRIEDVERTSSTLCLDHDFRPLSSTTKL